MPPPASRSVDPARERVVIGRVAGPHGVRGWLKLQSYTEPPEQLLSFPQWRTQAGTVEGPVLRPLEGRRHGRGLVARVEGVADRDAAEAIGRPELWVARGELPPLGPGEYYRADLVGLAVEDLGGRRLGRVDHFLDPPGNPVMVVRGEREHWVPLAPGRLRRVELERGAVVVDWDPDF